MTDPSPHSILDFKSPRRPTMEALRQLSTWQSNICSHTQDSWSGLLAHKVSIQAGKIESMQYQTALHRLPEDGLGVYFSFGEALLPSMLVLSGRQVMGLIADLLDLPADQLPVAASLSAAEESMLELLFSKLADAVGEAWPQSKPLQCQFLETTSRPQRTRLFPIGAPLFSMRLKMVSRFGEEACTWLMLKEETERLILENFVEPEPEERGINPNLLELTEKVPMEITVELGKVELRMSQASSLAVGDVLILDQYVSRPLIATLDGQPKWAGTPKRIGSRQAFEVTHTIDGDSFSSLPKFTNEDEENAA
ncbi:FliM/FliN family flagellar motor switch protein [Planctomicrobium sp. SH661]|uniref:FliM/FliN family flagellar motor switch protein n=1 Tax=Planctomicrobium sp. SH661 TaxID=3448124 RepID=UPI003F5B87D9